MRARVLHLARILNLGPLRGGANRAPLKRGDLITHYARIVWVFSVSKAVRSSPHRWGNMLFHVGADEAQPQATDGRSLFGESAATQAMFTVVWGSEVPEEWVKEHNAALASHPSGASSSASPAATPSSAPVATPATPLSFTLRIPDAAFSDPTDWAAFAGRVGPVVGQREQPESPGLFTLPMGLAIGPDHSVYVADTGDGRAQRFSSDGQLLDVIGQTGQEPGQFDRPRSIAVDGQGALYVADAGDQRIQRIATDGTVTAWQSGVAGTPNDAIQTNTPSGLVIDAQGGLDAVYPHAMMQWDTNGAR